VHIRRVTGINFIGYAQNRKIGKRNNFKSVWSNQTKDDKKEQIEIEILSWCSHIHLFMEVLIRVFVNYNHPPFRSRQRVHRRSQNLAFQHHVVFFCVLLCNCSFCWYWWNWWPSLIKLSFHD